VSIDASSNLAFAGGAIGLMDLPNSGLGYAYFIAKGTLSGNSPPTFQWAKRSPSSAGSAQGMAFDSSGHVVIAGWLIGTVDFGGVSATGPATGSAFVAQYNK